MEIYSITTLTKHWVLNFKVYGTCTGTKKVWLQSTPSLHRDKKSKSFELQSARNLHRDKKTKTLEGYLPQIDCKVFVFFGCFVPVQVWCTLKFNTFVFCPCAGLVYFEVQNLDFFVPVQVWCTLRLKSFLFSALWRFGVTYLLKYFPLICTFKRGKLNPFLKSAKPKSANMASQLAAQWAKPLYSWLSHHQCSRSHPALKRLLV